MFIGSGGLAGILHKFVEKRSGLLIAHSWDSIRVPASIYRLPSCLGVRFYNRPQRSAFIMESVYIVGGVFKPGSFLGIIERVISR